MISYTNELFFNCIDQKTENSIVYVSHLSFFEKDMFTLEKAKILFVD